MHYKIITATIVLSLLSPSFAGAEHRIRLGDAELFADLHGAVVVNKLYKKEGGASITKWKTSCYRQSRHIARCFSNGLGYINNEDVTRIDCGVGTKITQREFQGRIRAYTRHLDCF